MKTEHIILFILGAFGLIALIMWMQRNTAMMQFGQQNQQQYYRTQQQLQRSNNETVGGVVNTLATTGTLSAIAGALGNIFGGGGGYDGGYDYGYDNVDYGDSTQW